MFTILPRAQFHRPPPSRRRRRPAFHWSPLPAQMPRAFADAIRYAAQSVAHVIPRRPFAAQLTPFILLPAVR